MGFYPPPLTNIGGAQPLTPRKLAPSITAVEVDNPPFDQRQWFTRVLQIWNAPPPLPQVLGPINPSVTNVAINNPNPISYANLYLIARTWDPPQGPVLPPVSPPFTSGAAVTANNPPFDGRQWFFKVRAIWDLPVPQPVQKLPLNPQLEAVPVNNPPFNSRHPNLYTILSIWNLPAPLTVQQAYPSHKPITSSVFTDAVTESGSASDAASQFVVFANSVTEAGNASDTVGSSGSAWSKDNPAGGTWTKQTPDGGTWTKVTTPGGTWTKH